MCFEDRAGLFGAIASDLDDTGGLFKFDDYFALEPQAVSRFRNVVCKDVDPIRWYLCHLESEGVLDRRRRLGRSSWRRRRVSELKVLPDQLSSLAQRCNGFFFVGSGIKSDGYNLFQTIAVFAPQLFSRRSSAYHRRVGGCLQPRPDFPGLRRPL